MGVHACQFTKVGEVPLSSKLLHGIARWPRAEPTLTANCSGRRRKVKQEVQQLATVSLYLYSFGSYWLGGTCMPNHKGWGNAFDQQAASRDRKMAQSRAHLDRQLSKANAEGEAGGAAARNSITQPVQLRGLMKYLIRKQLVCASCRFPGWSMPCRCTEPWAGPWTSVHQHATPSVKCISTKQTGTETFYWAVTACVSDSGGQGLALRPLQDRGRQWHPARSGTD